MTEKELRNKLHENGCYLLGQIPLNEEEYNSIMSYAKSIINLDEKFIIIGPDLRLSIALVLIAINEYQDGKYWEKLKNKFELDELSTQKQTILGKIFLITLKEYKLFELTTNSSVTQYVENIKAHAFVTNNYMYGFYDFLYDYYDNNLFRDISNGVEDTLQDLSDYIKTTLNQNDDIIYSDSTSNAKTKKSYRLLKSTRSVIAQCNGAVLYQLFYPSLKIIDNYFFNGILPENNNGRFAKIFVEYTKRIEKEINENKNINRTRMYSHRPYIMFNASKYAITPFELVVPKRRFRPTECDGRVKMTIKINDVPRPPKYLEISKNMGTYISEEYRCIIAYPFDDIKIQMESLENFETEILSKNYIIFNSNFINTSRFEKGENYLFVKPHTLIEFSDSSIMIEKEKTEEWTQYKLNINEESICYINGKPLTIIGEFSKEPVFEDEIKSFGTYNDKEQPITSTRMHPLISLELDKDKKMGTTIKVNNKNYTLDNNEYIAIYESPINKNQFIISLDLNDFIENTNGYYKVELNIPGESNKTIAEYLLLNNVDFLFDKKRYIYSLEGKLTVKTDGMKIKILDDECRLIYSNEFQNSYYYKFEPNANYKNISAEMICDDKIFYIKVPIKMLLYGFSANKLMYGKPEEIWYSKLKELIYIKLPDVQRLGIYSEKNLDTVIWGDEVDTDLYRINISQKIEDISRETNRKLWNYLNIRYIDDTEDSWINLFVVIKGIKIEPYFDFEFYNEIPCFNVKFKEIEGIKIFYSIIKSDTKEKIIEHRELLNGINYLPEIERDVRYDIIPTIEENDEFGFNTKVTNLQLIRGRGIISYNKFGVFNNIDFPNNIININEILFDDNSIRISKLHRYKIEIIEYYSDIKQYLGKLYECEYKYSRVGDRTLLNETQRICLGKVQIENIEIINQREILFNLESYSENDNEWYDLFYVKEKRRLIENDNELLDKLKINEVIELNSEHTKFKVIK